MARRAYNAGELGSAKELASNFSGDVLNAQGKLPPYGTLSAKHRYEFDRWISSARVRQTLSDQMQAARLAVRNAHWPGC